MTLNADAVIIGIDEYERQGIPKLPGCVNDAVNAANWLIAIGVPPDRIIAHVSPLDARLFPAGVGVLAANDKAIRASFNRLSKGAGGDRLFLFMSGHGRYVMGGGGPVFLCQDYLVNDSTRENLKIEEYIEWFQSWPYRDQFLFYDACQDDTASVGQISPVQASGPDAQPGTYKPDPAISFTVCYACTPGQRAWAGDGRGVLVRFSLQALQPKLWAGLHPDDPEQDAIQYDWTTGARVVDLNQLFRNIISARITEAASAAKKFQTPYCRTFGRALIDGLSPILELPPLPTTTVTVDVDPPIAIGDVQSIKLQSNIIPKAYFMPLKGAPLKIPTSLKLPRQDRINTGCRLLPNSPWQAINVPLHQTLDKPVADVILQLRQPPGTSPAKSGGADEISIVVNGGVGSLPPQVDRDLASPFPAGMSFRKDSSGPTIRLHSLDVGTIFHANHVAAGWLKAMRKYNRDSGATILSPMGQPKDLRPTVHFDFDESSAALIGGYLEDDECVMLISFSDEIPARTMSLRDLEQHPVEWLEHGQYRLSIDLPWGCWTSRFRAGGKAVTVKLPQKIGLEPLRNIYRRDELGFRPKFLQPDEPFGSAIVPFAISQKLWVLPATGVPIAVLRTENGVRAEPFSETSLREWDDLLSVGRLDIQDAAALVQKLDGTIPNGTSEEFGLFALAAAFAEYDQRNFSGLEAVLEVMSRHEIHFDDLELLQLALDLASEKLVGNERQQAIGNVLGKGGRKLPVFRWGVALLVDLARQAELPLPRWVKGTDASSVLTLLNQSSLPAKMLIDFSDNRLVVPELKDSPRRLRSSVHEKPLPPFDITQNTEWSKESAGVSLHDLIKADEPRLLLGRLTDTAEEPEQEQASRQKDADPA